MAGREGLWMAETDRPAEASQATRSGESGLAVRLQLRRTQSDPAAATDGSTTRNATGKVCLSNGCRPRDHLPEAARPHQHSPEPHLNRFPTGRNENQKEKRRNQKNFNKFLGRVFAVAFRQGQALRAEGRSARGVAQDVQFFTAAPGA